MRADKGSVKMRTAALRLGRAATFAIRPSGRSSMTPLERVGQLLSCYVRHRTYGGGGREYIGAFAARKQMRETPSCVDCLGLVGAPPLKEPHSGLVPSVKDSEGRGQFQCTTCGYRWLLGPLGWSRLWD